LLVNSLGIQTQGVCIQSHLVALKAASQTALQLATSSGLSGSDAANAAAAHGVSCRFIWTTDPSVSLTSGIGVWHSEALALGAVAFNCKHGSARSAQETAVEPDQFVIWCKFVFRNLPELSKSYSK